MTLPLDATFWWLAAGAAVIAELLSGTFYLLMVALGFGAGALAAHLGLPMTAQTIAAAVAGTVAVGLCWRFRRSRTAPPPPQANPDMNLDIGQHVHVEAWDAEGATRVHYRGAMWQARLAAPEPAPAPGTYVIRAIDGAVLLLGR